MPSAAPTADEYRPVGLLLRRLRRQIRSYVLLEAVLLVLVALGLAFWAGLLLDWAFEPPPAVRMAVQVMLALVLGGILVWWGLRRWLVRLSDRSLALVVERHYPDLREVLSSAVDLQYAGTNGTQVHAELAQRTIRSAAQAAESIDTDHLLNQIRLNRFALAAGGLGISIIILAISLPRVWSTYADRLALSPEKWPRSVQLTLDGFEPDDHGGWIRKVARNSDVPIVVRASLEGGLQAPERVLIRYRWQEGRRGRDDLVRIGDAVAGRDASQRYEYLFERIASNVEFDVRGGDDRIQHVRLEVVERPKVTGLEFACEYPAYLGRAPRQIAVGPRIELPEGTHVVAIGAANKPLAEVRWQRVTQSDEAPSRAEQASPDFASEFDLVADDVELEVALLDTDGIASAEPFRVTIATRRDQKPQVAVSRDGIGTAVTADARIPLEVDVEDDNGARSAWLELTCNAEQLQPVQVPLPAGDGRDVVTLATVDLAELAKANAGDPHYQFAAGQKLSIVAVADDKYDLDSQPRAARARNLAFEIVTEDELLAQLATAEQNLRQTFEAVADKLLLQYDAIEKLDDRPLDRAAASGSDADLLVVDTSATAAADNVDDRLARETARLAENARQIGDEVLGIAGGFEDIHAQLFNNRIDNTELADRIGNRIAVPLRHLGGERMAAVADAIDQITLSSSSTASAKEQTRQAIVEVEALLREMQGLENYNEVIAMLRDIIRQQNEINTKTKEQQKDNLRNLLLD